jgi:hypothetical protein
MTKPWRIFNRPTVNRGGGKEGGWLDPFWRIRHPRKCKPASGKTDSMALDDGIMLSDRFADISSLRRRLRMEMAMDHLKHCPFGGNCEFWKLIIQTTKRDMYPLSFVFPLSLCSCRWMWMCTS